jgi:phosphatidylserine/phosphatidylglycerophosphate/cardiolipin synthase-like enzyme
VTCGSHTHENCRNDPSPLKWLKDHSQDLKKLVLWAESKKVHLPQLNDFADKLANWSLDDMVNALGGPQGQLQALSWNHGKILAVNGKTLMTGGANYWDQNTTKVYDIIEQQAKIKGDAAVSAHLWSDYFWRQGPQLNSYAH